MKNINIKSLTKALGLTASMGVGFYGLTYWLQNYEYAAEISVTVAAGGWFTFLFYKAIEG